ncbi:DEAD/DEAH box helicase [Aquipuribacter hungaricus]|uniref:DEAD/DEAH box helicase n=1 Tax=Aquipuribacter hungaricus TaxID=545624 RepID=A0ABV7WK87_9MICO
MPRLDKTCVTQFANTGCEKQLRVALHPDVAAHRPERAALDLPHPQVRPALAEIRNAGNEWGYSKVHDLSEAFGAGLLVGGTSSPTVGTASPGLRFADSELLGHLRDGVPDGAFLIETEFDADTVTFRATHGLNGLITHGVSAPLAIARVRPDVIEVIPRGAAGHSGFIVSQSGDLRPVADDDDRQQLRIVDVKLTSEPGPHYFSELAYYTLTLACWLREHGLDDEFSVSAEPAVWPGSETDSTLQKAVADGVDLAARYAAFHSDLETAPLRIFLADLARLLHDALARVLATPLPDLPWAVTPGCQGCENLGQKFKSDPGTQPADWDPRHCLPTAETTQDLSRLPFVSRGAARVLRERGHHDVPSVAALPDTHETFDAHHRLRGQRTVVAARARALSAAAVPALVSPTATTSAIPSFAKLRLFVTADFDPGSAVTLAFGLRWAWLAQPQLTSVARTRVHYVPGKTVDDEWPVFALLLDDLDALLNEARAQDQNADAQVYVWDSVTLEHLTRVVGRHLGNIIASNRLSRLAWLFPPEEILDAPHLASSPAVSVVRDAVKALLSLDLAHTYTLLETARHYHDPGHPNPTFWVPTFWQDPFSDQIPPERAHQLWRGRMTPGAPTQVQLMTNLSTTVNAKLGALVTISDRLGQDLRGRLSRKAPKISQLRGPNDQAGTSHLGLLLACHAKLNAALQELEISRRRALPAAEREATFASARLGRRLVGQAATDALAALGLSPGAHRAVYTLAPGSREVKAKLGDFSWAVAPENAVGLLERKAGSLIRQDAALDARWSGNFQALNQKMTKVLGVTIRGIDRDRLLIALDFDNYGDATPVRDDLLAAGAFQVDHDLVMDPVAVDWFTAKVEKTAHAIGNPPKAVREPRIQAALGVTRNPRAGKIHHPVEDYLWDALTTADTAIYRDTVGLKQELEALGYELNDSQWTAWERSLTRRLALIWGPPGTGKTKTVRAVLAALAADSTRAGGQPLRIAVAAQTYTAVDNVIRSVAGDIAAHWPTAEIRRLRSSGRSAPDWLPTAWDVNSSDPAAIQATTKRLAEAATTIVGGTSDQLYKLIKEAAGTAGELFDVIVVDEAGQLDVAHALLVLAGAAAGATVIVAGDPKQLPPIHAAEAPAGLQALVGSVYGFFRDWHGVQENPLLVNYRSNAEIVALGQRAGYPSNLRAHRPGLRIRYTPDAAAQATASDQRPDGWPLDLPYSADLARVADPTVPVVCLTYPEGVSGQWNQFEADVVTGLVRWYAASVGAGLADLDDPVQEELGAVLVDPETFWKEVIGVITPHRAQRARIVDRLTRIFVTPEAHVDTGAWIADAVETVERFQGQERAIILASYAVGDPDTVAEEAEFLHDLNRFNVLATRAMAKLVVIASRELVSHISGDLKVIRSSEMLKDFVDTFCGYSEAATLGWDSGGAVRHVAVELRTHQP